MNDILHKKIESFRANMKEWYAENGRKFPWRSPRLSNYQLIIAEVLLQRTRADTIAGYYPVFISKYPSWEAIINANYSDLENTLKPIGLYSQRANRLKLLAEQMHRRRGVISRSPEDLTKIPQIGQYIAHALLSIKYDYPYPMLDVNMARVIERVFGKRKLSDIRFDPYLQGLSFSIINTTNTKELNWAILDFAALVCKPRNPECSSCTNSKICNFFIMKQVYFKIILIFAF